MNAPQHSRRSGAPASQKENNANLQNVREQQRCSQGDQFLGGSKSQHTFYCKLDSLQPSKLLQNLRAQPTTHSDVFAGKRNSAVSTLAEEDQNVRPAIATVNQQSFASSNRTTSDGSSAAVGNKISNNISKKLQEVSAMPMPQLNNRNSSRGSLATSQSESEYDTRAAQRMALFLQQQRYEEEEEEEEEEEGELSFKEGGNYIQKNQFNNSGQEPRRELRAESLPQNCFTTYAPVDSQRPSHSSSSTSSFDTYAENGVQLNTGAFIANTAQQQKQAETAKSSAVRINLKQKFEDAAQASSSSSSSSCYIPAETPVVGAKIDTDNVTAKAVAVNPQEMGAVACNKPTATIDIKDMRATMTELLNHYTSKKKSLEKIYKCKLNQDQSETDGETADTSAELLQLQSMLILCERVVFLIQVNLSQDDQWRKRERIEKESRKKREDALKEEIGNLQYMTKFLREQRQNDEKRIEALQSDNAKLSKYANEGEKQIAELTEALKSGQGTFVQNLKEIQEELCREKSKTDKITHLHSTKTRLLEEEVQALGKRIEQLLANENALEKQLQKQLELTQEKERYLSESQNEIACLHVRVQSFESLNCEIMQQKEELTAKIAAKDKQLTLLMKRFGVRMREDRGQQPEEQLTTSYQFSPLQRGTNEQSPMSAISRVPTVATPHKFSSQINSNKEEGIAERSKINNVRIEDRVPTPEGSALSQHTHAMIQLFQLVGGQNKGADAGSTVASTIQVPRSNSLFSGNSGVRTSVTRSKSNRRRPIFSEDTTDSNVDQKAFKSTANLQVTPEPLCARNSYSTVGFVSTDDASNSFVAAALPHFGRQREQALTLKRQQPDGKGEIGRKFRTNSAQIVEPKGGENSFLEESLEQSATESNAPPDKDRFYNQKRGFDNIQNLIARNKVSRSDDFIK